MSKYKDINTGLEYDELPEGKVLPIIVKGLPVTEEAYERYYENHPIELTEHVVTPQKPKSTTMAAYYDRLANSSPDNYIRYINRMYNDLRIRNANHWQGVLNVMQPSQWVGSTIDAIQGEQDFLSGLWYGNNGIVPDNFARNHPYLAMMANTAFDLASSYGGALFYKWGTTPRLIGSGANKKVYSAPFSRKVYFEGVDPEYIQTLNNIPGSLPYKLEKYSIDGAPIYSQPKVRMVSKPSKGFIRNAIKNQFFPTKVAGDTETVFMNPVRLQVMLDTEWGRNLFGRTYAVDPEVLSIPEYFSILKKGGKLNGTTCKKNRF